MAIFQETVRSLRFYLLLVGAVGTLLNLIAIVASETAAVMRLLLLPGLALSVVALYLGFTLATKLKTSLPFVLNVFRAVILLNAFYLVLGIAGTLLAGARFSVLPILGILVGWYLLKNARRLGTGLQAASE